ncbi:hypothetical protein [Pseudolactococcus insecticola]|uniref:Uncharacterized protein n=1 Tax=Pseudolactococcus insecticola TaxID=2709158 RepID=A0A6A0BAJ6_9LACT|nr:hypothetical protein [Lactococcus insecticola]GFH41404.1 hypothetical protein Hs20B_18020 [Lactococcus insecticola]
MANRFANKLKTADEIIEETPLETISKVSEKPKTAQKTKEIKEQTALSDSEQFIKSINKNAVEKTKKTVYVTTDFFNKINFLKTQTGIKVIPILDEMIEIYLNNKDGEIRKLISEEQAELAKRL